MITILIVDDNVSIRRLLDVHLSHEGYEIIHAGNGREALDQMVAHAIDLIILDIMMPQMDGFEFLKRIRHDAVDTPVLMITADINFESEVKGFHLGTDDYLTKPLNMQEVSLRVASLLRRAKINRSRILTIGQVELDERSLQVRMDDEILDLPKKEFQLLFKLLSYPNQIFTRRTLLDDIWRESDAIDRTIDVHINRLREKFDHRPEFKIVTVKGVGYKAVVQK